MLWEIKINKVVALLDGNLFTKLERMNRQGGYGTYIMGWLLDVQIVKAGRDNTRMWPQPPNRFVRYVWAFVKMAG